MLLQLGHEETSTLGLLIVTLLGTTALAQSGPDHDELSLAASSATDWLYPGHDAGAQRYVPAASLDDSNVGGLQAVCLYQVGVTGSFQANPLVYRGVLYFGTAQDTIALDASDCTQIWRHTYQPEAPGGAAAQRGLAIKDGLVIRGTTDGMLLALDAQDGSVVWRAPAVEAGSGESVPMAPMVYEDLVIVGPATTPRGWVAAFDLYSGAPVWKFDLLPKPGEPAAETWGDPDTLTDGSVGGASVWTAIALDEERGVIHVPVGAPEPAFSAELRPGDNLYTSSVVMLDARTGELLWHHQLQPGNTFGWDTTQAGPLFSTTVDGVERDLAAVIGKDGVLHVLDRETRELVYRTDIARQENVGAAPDADGEYVCPGYLGGVQWNGPAYNPDGDVLYAAVVNWCSTFTVDPASDREGTFEMDPLEQATGQLVAVDAATGDRLWEYDSNWPMLAAVTTTAGNLVLTGELGGDLIALNATTGAELYRFNTGGAIAGGVVTYELDGTQYVAVMSGNQSPLWASRGAATVLLFAIP